MSPALVLVIYCVLILLASLAGGWIPLLIKLTHKRMELAVSFVAGVMLGVGLLHLLPHAILARLEGVHDHDSGPTLNHEMVHELIGPIMLWLLAGFLVMFIIERFFCFHHHDAPASDSGHECDLGHGHEHAHHHHDGSDHVHPPHTHAPTKHHLTWTGAAIGLSIHSLIEGVALAASIEVARQSIHDGHDHGTGGGVMLAGLGTFLVIFLHKPFDSLTIGTLMSMGGHSTARRHLVNIAFSMLVIVGVVLFRIGAVSAGGGNGHMMVSAVLAFSAGTFLCIAMSDLLPELQFHQHDRIKLSFALLTGLAIAWLIAVMEARMEH